MDREELINKAVEYGIPRKLAEKKATGWLTTFVDTRTKEDAKLQRELGSAGLEAGAMVRRNYGI